MFRFATIILIATSFAACDAVNTMKEGFAHAKAVESDVEAFASIRPNVGFNWSNGRLVSVTVAFPKIYEANPLRELADTVRASVIKQFQQTPENIVLAFSLGK
jgi:hypothetical protein